MNLQLQVAALETVQSSAENIGIKSGSGGLLNLTTVLDDHLLAGLATATANCLDLGDNVSFLPRLQHQAEAIHARTT